MKWPLRIARCPTMDCQYAASAPYSPAPTPGVCPAHGTPLTWVLVSPIGMNDASPMPARSGTTGDVPGTPPSGIPPVRS